MTKIQWDKIGERRYETGVDHGVLYIPNSQGNYAGGVGWNGLTAVTESPTGAESNKQYADNQVYVNLLSAEEFGATIEAFTYPDEFAQCDGTAEPIEGISVSQQSRKTFGFSWRTLVGNDTEGNDFGYKIHLAYGLLAAPSEKANATVNDSPELTALSWEVSSTPIEVPGLKPSAHITLDSTRLDADALSALEEILYGTAGQEPRLPLPEELFALFAGTVVEVAPTEPSYNAATDTITIPATAGVIYEIDGDVVTGAVVITEDTVVTARPAPGYKFPAVSDNDWFIEYT